MSMNLPKVVKMRQEWIARSLTSIAPRYHSRTGECSIYSSLSQFTAPELLTGSNKWACDRCTQLASTRQRDEHDAKDSDEEEREDDEQKKKPKKPPTVYSNASKQLLIFSPPAVLTVHLKR
jgi:ubiquitin carboxyl-terminal hydrolase 16/45